MSTGMYTVECTIKGTAPLLQNRFPMPTLASLSKGGKRVTGAIDYSEEWQEKFYRTKEGLIFQPSEHFEGALVKSAVNWKIPGKRGKTYKDLFRAAVFVTPERIMHEGFTVPEIGQIDEDPEQPLYIDMRPVVVQRARVTRLRPAFRPGWRLNFNIEVTDDQISEELLLDILTMAGKTVGVGDFRPKFGRFQVIKFEVLDNGVVEVAA